MRKKIEITRVTGPIRAINITNNIKIRETVKITETKVVTVNSNAEVKTALAPNMTPQFSTIVEAKVLISSNRVVNLQAQDTNSNLKKTQMSLWAVLIQPCEPHLLIVAHMDWLV